MEQNVSPAFKSVKCTITGNILAICALYKIKADIYDILVKGVLNRLWIALIQKKKPETTVLGLKQLCQMVLLGNKHQITNGITEYIIYIKLDVQI